MNASSNDTDLCQSVMPMLRAWLMVYSLLLPLFLYVLCVGCKQWKKQQSAMSHSDVFTFIIISIDILLIISSGLYLLSAYYQSQALYEVADDVYCISLTGQAFMHGLTCMEHYLAVVHPITYLRLKKRGGVMVRNVSIAIVWFATTGFQTLQYIPSMDRFYYFKSIIVLTFISVILVAFCSGSVLCVLIRPGPGEGGRGLRRIDQSKRRAFYSIMVIMGVLMVRFVALVVTYLLSSLPVLNLDWCMLTMIAGWFTLPSSLVVPLMFLHRAGKLPKCAVKN